MMRNLPLPHLLPLVLNETFMDTFKRDDFQSDCFWTKFVDRTKTNGESEPKNEKFANGVPRLFFGTSRDKIGSDEGRHDVFLLLWFADGK